MSEPATIPENGLISQIDGCDHIYYDGYWIRYYVPPPEEALATRKLLIDSLTRRAFHNTESGINTPGDCLDAARTAYETEADPARKRVNAAMLAGALFNRATDIFTAVVNLAEKGVKVSRQNELMQECSNAFKEALELGKQVKHYSGEEGIDEVWGEPFKVFTSSARSYYESRYIKIAQAMRDIDRVVDVSLRALSSCSYFGDVAPLFQELGTSAKLEAATMRSDPDMFQIWPRFVAAREAVQEYSPAIDETLDYDQLSSIQHGIRLLRRGAEVVSFIAGARVSMPDTLSRFLQMCDHYQSTGKWLDT